MLPDRGAHFRQKRFKFLWAVRGPPDPNRGCHLPTILRLRRSEIVGDAFAAFGSPRVDASSLRRRLKVEFAGEPGIDSGGLTKDFFLEVGRAIVRADYGLFRRPNPRAEGVEKVLWEPSPLSQLCNESHLEYFFFFGRLLGKAIFERQTMDVALPTYVIKHLLAGRPGHAAALRHHNAAAAAVAADVGLEDLDEIDPALARSLRWMLREENDISGVLFECFCVEEEHFGERVTIDLMDGGRHVAVTNENKSKYVELLVAHRCGGAVRAQLSAILSGFHELIPTEAVAVFSCEEFSLLLNGRSEVSVEAMRAGARLSGGYHMNSPAVVWFWETLGDMAAEERAAVLRFVTGASRVPLDGFDPCFTITKGTSFEQLPAAHTCFNQLVLPAYPSKEKLAEKLGFALRETSGFHLT